MLFCCNIQQYSSIGLISCHVCSDKAAPPEMPIVIDHIALKDILGPPLFEMEVSGAPTAFAFCTELMNSL